jgi:hypothetical protein
MKLILEMGQVRAEMRAERNSSQHLVDVIFHGAARPYTLIGRAIVDHDPVFGNKRGRMLNGWQFAHTVAGHRFIALAYRPPTGLPVSERQLGAPAYAWWPQLKAAGEALGPSPALR